MPDMTAFTKQMRNALAFDLKKFILEKTTHAYVITAAKLKNSVAFNERLSVLDSRIEHARSIDETLITEMTTARASLKASLINLNAEDKVLAEGIIDILTSAIPNETQLANDLVKIFNASRAASPELLTIVKSTYDALRRFIKKNAYSSKTVATEQLIAKQSFRIAALETEASSVKLQITKLSHSASAHQALTASALATLQRPEPYLLPKLLDDSTRVLPPL